MSQNPHFPTTPIFPKPLTETLSDNLTLRPDIFGPCVGSTEPTEYRPPTPTPPPYGPDQARLDSSANRCLVIFVATATRHHQKRGQELVKSLRKVSNLYLLTTY